MNGLVQELVADAKEPLEYDNFNLNALISKRASGIPFKSSISTVMSYRIDVLQGKNLRYMHTYWRVRSS